MFESTAKKACIAGAGFILAAGMAGTLMTQPAQAKEIPSYNGAAITNLTAGTACSKFDLNGDGVNDTITYTLKVSKYDDEAYTKLTLKVNKAKKIVIKNSHFYKPTVSVFKFASGKSLVYVNMPDDNDYNTACLYKYNGKKITRAWKNTKGLFGKKYGSHMCGSVSKVSGDKFTVTYSTQPNVCGQTNFKYNFSYASTKVVRTSNATKAKSTFLNGKKTVKWSPTTKEVSLYTGLSLTKWTTMKKGTNAKVIGIYLQGSKQLIKVITRSGSIGYVQANDVQFKGSTAKTLFKYAVFAG